ncbi:MAG: hypothetical protein V1853_00010 [bacterium]
MNSPEVTLMAICAAKQLGMEDAELATWAEKFCQDVLGRSVTPERVIQELGTIPEHNDPKTYMPWFAGTAKTLGIKYASANNMCFA